MIRRPLLVVAVVYMVAAVPTEAPAARKFLWSAEICKVDTRGDWDDQTAAATQPFSGYGTGQPEKSSTTFGDKNDGTANNLCSISMTPVSGASEYLEADIGTVSATLYAAMWFRMDSGAPTTRRKIMSFSNGSKTGCMLTVEKLTLGGVEGFKVKAFYEDDGKECTSSLNDGTECTTTASCDQNNDGEAQCLAGTYATTSQLTYNTWYSLTLGQANTLGDVNCSLWQGPIGASYLRGGRDKPQGKCSGGDDANDACKVDGDCTGGGTCALTDVVTVNKVRFGTDDTVSEAITYLVDNFIIDNAVSTGLTNYRIVSLRPNADGTANQWLQRPTSGHCQGGGQDAYECVDDTTDGEEPEPTDEGHLATVTDGHVSDVNLVDLEITDDCNEAATPDVCVDSGIPCSGDNDTERNTSCTPVTMSSANTAVAAVLDVKDYGDASHTSTDRKDIQIQFMDSGGDTDTFTKAEINLHQNETYLLNGYHLRTTDPDGNTWSDTIIDGLQHRMTADINFSSDKRPRVSAITVDVGLTLPDPPVPAIIPDRDSDGADTVCIIGDSTMNDAVFEDELLANLVEADNIIFCTTGGTTTGDVEANLTTDPGILLGNNANYPICTVNKGSAASCDVAFYLLGINSMRGANLADPVDFFACTTSDDCLGGTCVTTSCTGLTCGSTTVACDDTHDCSHCTVGQVGYCDMNGESGEGDACYCPGGENDAWLSKWSASSKKYCSHGYEGVEDQAFKETCSTTLDCYCSADSDCDDLTCGTCSNALYAADQSTCEAASGTWYDDRCRTTAYGVGMSCAVNSERPNDWCAVGCLDGAGCSGGLCKMPNSLGAIQDGVSTILTAADAHDSDVITVLGTLPPAHEPAVLTLPTEYGCWQTMNSKLGAYNAWLIAKAEAGSRPWVDMWRVFERDCTDGNSEACLRDGIHWNDSVGQIKAAAAIVACLTHGSDEVTPRDGVCASKICTSGRGGDACGRCSNGDVCEDDGGCDSGTCTDNNAACDIYDCTALRPYGDPITTDFAYAGTGASGSATAALPWAPFGVGDGCDGVTATDNRDTCNLDATGPPSNSLVAKVPLHNTRDDGHSEVLSVADFGITGPASGDIIDGIEVKIRRYSKGANTQDEVIRLIKPGDGVVGDNLVGACSDTDYVTRTDCEDDGATWTECSSLCAYAGVTNEDEVWTRTAVGAPSGADWEEVIYGSSTSLWGTTLSPTDVTHADFGVSIKVRDADVTISTDVNIDYVQIRVSYREPS